MSRFQYLIFPIEGSVTERLQRYYGELIGAAHKVQFVALGLEDALRIGDLSSAIEHVEYHVENYLSRVYQLRDRAIAAAETAYGGSLSDLRHRDRRPALSSRLEARLPKVTSPLFSLIQLIDQDIQTHNTLTHRTALHLHVSADDGQMLDPSTVLMGISDHPDRKKIEKTLRTDLADFVEPYTQRIEAVFHATIELANAFDLFTNGD